MKIIHSVRPKKFKNKKILTFVFNLIRLIFKGDRFNRLTNEVNSEIKLINKILKRKSSLLDYGCGSMHFSNFLIKKKTIKNSTCVDTYQFAGKLKKNTVYYTTAMLENKKIKSKKFDVTILIDVLHHMDVDYAHIYLKKISKISKFILIKDHFEHGFFSRHFLRFVDFFGNYSYGVNIPDKYFNYSTWTKTIKKSHLKQITFKKKFQQHDGFFNFILNKKHHFISILK